MNDFSEIIGKIGIAAFAKMIVVDESHARAMKARNSIPPEYWGLLIAKAPECGLEGLTYESLRLIRTGRFPHNRKSKAPSDDRVSAC